MPNPFDQFDPTQQNPFDQFDAPAPLTSRIEAVGRGAEQGAAWGFRDEAEGADGAIREMNAQNGWIGRGANLVRDAYSIMPGLNVGQGIADAALGVGTELATRADSENPMAQSYRAHRDERRDIDQQAVTDRPGYYLAGELAGGIASGPPAGAAARAPGIIGRAGARLNTMSGAKGLAARGAAGGAAYGAVGGFGYGNEGLGERIQSAGTGAAIGAAAGGTLAPLAAGVGALFSAGWRKAFTSSENRGLDMIIRRAEAQGTDLNQVRADFEELAQTGEVPETLAELMGARERGLLSGLITANRDTRETAGNVLLERGRGEVERLQAGFEDAMGVSGDDFKGVEAQIARSRAEDPLELYQAAHYDGTGANRVHRELAQDQTADVISILTDEEEAASLIASARQYANRMARKDSGLRATVTELRQLEDTLAAGQMPTRLTVQAGDMLERAINRRYTSAANGSVQDIPAGWRALRDDFRAIIDEGGLGDARREAADIIRSQELLDEGRGFLKNNVDPEDVEATLRGNPELDIPAASERGRAAYMAGGARGIADNVRSTPDMVGFADSTRKIARTPVIRDKINAMRPKRTRKDGQEDRRFSQTRMNTQLDRTIDRVADRAEFTNDMLGNSKTAFRQADMADAAADDSFGAHFGESLNDLLMGGPANLARAGWQRYGRWASDRVARPGLVKPKINSAAAKRLLASGDDIPKALDELTARQAQRNARGSNLANLPGPISLAGRGSDELPPLNGPKASDLQSGGTNPVAAAGLANSPNVGPTALGAGAGGFYGYTSDPLTPEQRARLEELEDKSVFEAGEVEEMNELRALDSEENRRMRAGMYAAGGAGIGLGGAEAARRVVRPLTRRKPMPRTATERAPAPTPVQNTPPPLPQARLVQAMEQEIDRKISVLNTLQERRAGKVEWMAKGPTNDDYRALSQLDDLIQSESELLDGLIARHQQLSSQLPAPDLPPIPENQPALPPLTPEQPQLPEIAGPNRPGFGETPAGVKVPTDDRGSYDFSRPLYAHVQFEKLNRQGMDFDEGLEKLPGMALPIQTPRPANNPGAAHTNLVWLADSPTTAERLAGAPQTGASVRTPAAGKLADKDQPLELVGRSGEEASLVVEAGTMSNDDILQAVRDRFSQGASRVRVTVPQHTQNRHIIPEYSVYVVRRGDVRSPDANFDPAKRGQPGIMQTPPELGGAAVGYVAGAMTAESEEEFRRNALIGAAIGAGGTHAARKIGNKRR